VGGAPGGLAVEPLIAREDGIGGHEDESRFDESVQQPEERAFPRRRRGPPVGLVVEDACGTHHEVESALGQRAGSVAKDVEPPRPPEVRLRVVRRNDVVSVDKATSNLPSEEAAGSKQQDA
jgi:hypothetical protein